MEPAASDTFLLPQRPPPAPDKKALERHLNVDQHLKTSQQTNTFLSFLRERSFKRARFLRLYPTGGVSICSAQRFSDLMLRELIQLLFAVARPKTRLKRSS